MARKSLGRFRFFPSGSTVKMVVTHFVNEDGTKAMKSYLPQTRVAPFGTFESEAVATPSLALNAEPKKTPENRLISVTYGGTIAQPGRPNEDAMFVGRLVGDPLVAVFDGQRECRGGFDLVDSSLYLFSEFLNGWFNLSGHRFSLILGRDYAHILCTQKS